MKKQLLSLVALALFLAPAQAQLVMPGGGSGGGGGGGSIAFPQAVTGGVSGGIPYLSTTTQLSASALLAANSLMVGGGAGAAPSTITTGLNVVTTLASALNGSGGIISPTPGAAGDIIYWNGTAWVKLVGNNSGTAFLSESASGVPSWAANGSGTITSVSTTCPVVTTSSGAATVDNGVHSAAKSSAYPVLAADCGKFFETTGTTTLTLPPFTGGTAVGLGFNVAVMNADATHTVTVTASAGNILSGGSSASSVTLTPGQTMVFVVNAAVTGWDGSTGPTGAAGATGATGPSTPVGPGYQVGPFYIPFMEPPQATAAAAISTSVAYCRPMWFNNILSTGGGTATIGLLYIRAIVLGSTNVTAAIYANDPTANPFRPGALLTNGATPQIPNTSLASFAGQIPYTTGPSISADTMYWACLQTGDTTMTYDLLGTTQAAPMSTFVGAATAAQSGSGSAVSTGVSVSVGSFGTWPSTLHGSTFTDGGSGRIPWFGFQFASIP